MEKGTIIEELLTKSTALNSLVVDNLMGYDKKESLLESALNSPLGDGVDSRVKKLMAAALHITASKEHMIDVKPIPLAIAPLVDEAFTRMKVSALLKAGKVDVYEAADKLIDRAAARLIVITDKVIAQGFPLVAGKLVDALAVYCPPIEVLAPFVKNLVSRLTPICQETVKAGIQKLSDYAKKTVKKVVEKVGPIIRVINRKAVLI